MLIDVLLQAPPRTSYVDVYDVPLRPRYQCKVYRDSRVLREQVIVLHVRTAA